ncbi:MAG: hypothetical protein ACM31C_34860 [Acidobacteriota bacterium]
MAKAKTKTGVAKKKAPAKKPAAKAIGRPKPKANPVIDEPQPVMSELGPHAERGHAALVCTQCDGTIDPGALRIVIDAGESLHPGCTFGWTLDHLTDPTATADWMAQLMQRSRLSPEDRAELLEELGAPI